METEAQAEQELEKLKMQLAGIFAALKPSIHGKVNLWQETYHIHRLHNILSRIKVLYKEIAGKKYFKQLQKLAEEFSKGNVKNPKKWERLFYENLIYIIEELKIHSGLNKERKWGTYKFSEIFPKTFEWLKLYVPFRRPEFN